MACRSCRSHVGQLARQSARFTSNSAEASSASSIIAASRLPAAPSQISQRQPTQQQQQRRKFSSTPRSQALVPDFIKNTIGSILQSSAQPYQVHRATEIIYKTCASQAHYTISEEDKRNGTVQKTEDGIEIGVGKTMWHTDFGLPATFSSWSQVTMLHMYLVCARLRNLDREAAKSWQQQLVDHYFFDAEERMDLTHGIASRGVRQRYLKDLFVTWRGLLAAYDEGVARGDAVLASAVWRNVFSAQPDVDVRAVAAVVSWMRLTLKMLDQMPDEALFSQAPAAFKWPAKNELNVVDKPVRELEGLLPDAPAVAAKAKADQPAAAPIQKVAV
ncbi:hypothetical protein PG985_007169 [Apiospora marii]|uniref:Ubiquinol-cytochrome c chaperone domain-containing protein n=1 Tax=Apiospora marii TaxID=335849 RepID=A0ABR1SEV0_9PEZI